MRDEPLKDDFGPRPFIKAKTKLIIKFLILGFGFGSTITYLILYYYGTS